MIQLSKEQIRETIARRAAQEFHEGDIVTLGIGLPTEVANYVSPSLNVLFHSENGLLGVGPKATFQTLDKAVTNAGGVHVETQEGAAFFDSELAFSMMRGGHVDATVLGALQVDSEGNLANWLVPNVFTPGMGGAMDLVVGAKKVIVVMEHTAKGQPKILQKCTLPLTAAKEVNLIITERCVIEVTPQGLLLKEINPLFSLEDILADTQADLIIPEDLCSVIGA